MKKKTINLYFAIIAAFLFFAIPIKLIALNYTITFTGTGASTSVQSVVVQNLTKGTTVTVPTGNVLNLTDVTTSIDKEIEMTNGISIYPNPLQTVSSVSFFAEQTGSTQISIFGLDGRKLIETNNVFMQGKNSFQLSAPNGVYVLQVRGNGFSYKTKFISQLNSKTKPQFIFASNNINQIGKKPQKSKSAVTTMLYSLGDQLLYKGISGNYCTIVTDKPIESKTTNFEFVECKDADNNYYSVVKIGTQTWMVENLKTTKYRNGEVIGTTTPATLDISGETEPKYQWAYNGDENYATKYGRLYTWYAAADARSIAPLGWRVPTDVEWTTFENYLIANGYNYDGSNIGNLLAKSLASTTDWATYSITGSIGNDLSTNNKSGFSALPGGWRFYNGVFYFIGNDDSLWSSTEINPTKASHMFFSYNSSGLGMGTNSKSYGFSVRCIRDETTNPF